MKSILKIIITSILLLSCSEGKKETSHEHYHHDSSHYVQPKRPAAAVDSALISPMEEISLEGMVLIPEGTFMMGASGKLTRRDEFPRHLVKVNSFYMDEHEVTNRQFSEFVEATGYVTIAERAPDWEEIKKQVPPGTPKPPDSMLVAGSMIFEPKDDIVSLNNFLQWWSWQPGADWRHPEGPGSGIEGKEDHPVVHVAWHDAVAYCKWRGGRLPTEAEWEWAARGGLEDKRYPWGDEHVEQGEFKANSWQGDFPNVNTGDDGFMTTAPVKSYPPNNFGLYDMAGNVWEWCSDWYHSEYYEQLKTQEPTDNPKGPSFSYDANDPYAAKRSQRGGSYLCNDVYCASYRVSARMPGEPSTGMPHVGFRCVIDRK